ncbi:MULTISPECIES: ubiquitin family protein [Methanobacterium]|jgi:sulfur carrier protein ThiS|uniref:Thiamine biosynthesis protein ThiS n=1 Tax=Methanobacterium bryantii TaxID=2161 RepID=A0A2A2H457_METBR|nr:MULTISPECIES: hypothetical protein [Methanobacterium]OEC84622.1 hypothetical protein A9507_15185 [Methanobacterium sp. A39]PAV04094.1 hypothetical protein ASJ80_03510 [Methanobacterium bryantii]
MKIEVSDWMNGNEEIEIDVETISGKDLLERLGISVFEATITKNSVIVRESEILTSSDNVKILKMIHGG